MVALTGRRSAAGWVALLTFALGGCATPYQVTSLPSTAGVSALYDMPADSVGEAVPGALAALGYGLVEPSAASDATMIVGQKGMSLWSYGEFARVLLLDGEDADTEVRVVARPRALLDSSGRTDRSPPRILASIDRALGPDRIVPAPGITVRGRLGDGGMSRGTVSLADAEYAVTLGDDRSVPLSSLQDASIRRGSFGRGSEGATVGLLMGLAVGFSGCSQYDCVLIWELGGALVGFVLGSAIRTEVWSPADFSGR